jgi:Tol biopolymer transport system component
MLSSSLIRRAVRVVPLLATGLAVSCGDDAGCDASSPLMPVCIDPAADRHPVEPALVFQTNRDGRIEIYTMNSDGSGAKRLTDNPGVDIMPRWSPDGTQIVFVSVRAGLGRELYVMNADGTDQRRLTDLGTNPGFPDWSPDGSRIAFHAARGDGNFDIFTMNADGSDVRRLTTTGSQLRPRWSPDGSRIAFGWFQSTATGICCGHIGIMNDDGSGFRIVTHGPENLDADWSPDGRRLAFSRWHSMHGGMMGNLVLTIINADGTGERMLGTNTMNTFGASWSKQTGRIYFMSTMTGNEQIYSVRDNGSDLRRVSSSITGDANAHAR